MNALKKIVFTVSLFSIMLLQTGCENKVDSTLSNMEKFANKWEQKHDAGTLTQNEREEMKKEWMIIEKSASGIDKNPDLTEEQRSRLMKVGEKLAFMLMGMQYGGTEEDQMYEEETVEVFEAIE